MKPINAEETVRVFNGWLEEADSLAEREAIERCIDHIQDTPAVSQQELRSYMLPWFSPFVAPWCGKIQRAFPKAYVTMNFELILVPRTNTYINLNHCSTPDEFKAEVIEGVSRFAFKGFTKPLCREHLDGINKLLDTHFTPEEIEHIYTNLGNGINHELCMKQLIKAHNADIDTEGTPEEFDMTLYEHLFDGPETIEGLLAEHYTLSWALASLRDKLKHYEDALIPEIMPEGLQTIDRAIGTYGKDAQLTKAVEEMSELTKALCKLKECKRKYDTPFNRETQEVYSNVEEETADVFIMLVQLFAIFNPHELVNITKVVWDKLDRLKDNLDKEAAKQEASDAGKE